MPEDIITKRIHVSGLTPALSAADISQRLGSFGTVKALDGLGKLDALGQPKKFAYVTIETTKSKLTKCMNLLSGVTWKGAKLRLGEAKPDFRERIAQENAPAIAEDGEPPRKKRRLPRGVQGVHADNMSPVTPETVQDRKGWKVTALGRMIHPVRMRPTHPLPDPIDVAAAPKIKKAGAKEKRKKPKEPPSRARRRTIDPTKFGSNHLKGAFLDAVVAYPDTAIRAAELVRPTSPIDSSDTDSSGPEHELLSEDQEEVLPVPSKPTPVARSVPSSHKSAHVAQKVQPKIQQKPSSTALPLDNDLLQEKTASLGLLQSLFGGKDDDWCGKESLSDVDMDEAREAPPMTTKVVDDLEVAPRTDASASSDDESEGEMLDVQSAAVVVSPEPPSAKPSALQGPEPKTKLKDLFAHREDEGGFSLLGHLDLDDELDEDDLNLGTAQPQIVQPVAEPMPTSAHVLTRPRAQAGFLSLDAKEPLFFPIPPQERASIKGRVKDLFDVARERGVDWRNFCRTQTEEEIKQRWEDNKKELTQEWKRRHREAIKSKRRRGGFDGGAE